MIQYQVKNSKGEPITLNQREVARAAFLQKQYNKEYRNALGTEVNITTLTAISKVISEQKFYQIPPADYLPVRVGEGAYSSEILHYRTFQLGDAGEKGIINTGSSQSRLASADAGYDTVRNPIVNWAMEIDYTLFDLAQASKAGNWDLVTAKETSRKTAWDLMIQKIAFYGLADVPTVKGLLTQSDVNIDTSTITKKLSLMTAAELNTFVATFIGKYRVNNDFTAYPNMFIMPEDDFNGLGSSFSETYPISNRYEALLSAFRMVTQNPNFQIKGLAYANQANNAAVTGLNKNRYTLMNYNDSSVVMDIPVNYTSTTQNSLNNFQFKSAAYGQFAGVIAIRPKEMLYFDWAA